MSPPVQIDFAGRRTRMSLIGVALLIVGMALLAAAGVHYRQLAGRNAGLALRLAAAQRGRTPDPVQSARAVRLSAETEAVARELAVPWTAVLADLEAASADSKEDIAVLSVEPDPNKHRILIDGESRDLGVALRYVERLQSSHSLRHPMLDSHEVVTQDSEHPVRFTLSADWQEVL